MNSKEPVQSKNLVTLKDLDQQQVEDMKKSAKEFWRDWMKNKVPALGNRSPKQAARSQDGKELLRALLNGLERQSRDNLEPMQAILCPNVAELRRELGLE